MKNILIPLFIFSLIFSGISCAPLTQVVINEALLPPLETGATVSMINYDSVYYSMIFYLSKHSWPTSKEELNDFAISKNHKINFEQYKYFSIEQCSPKRINIHFIIKKIEINNLSLNDIKGIVGIYIEDDKKIKIYNYEDKKILTSFTVAKYPYDAKSITTADGYSVHNFIEYHHTRNKKIGAEHDTRIHNTPIFKMQNIKIK